MAITKGSNATVSLQVQPHCDSMPSIAGSVVSKQAGALLYGHYNMDYNLPGGDRLRLLANHNKSMMQIILLTNNAKNLHRMPGKRPSSLIADSIAGLNRYLTRSDAYKQPRSEEQQAKYDITLKARQEITRLLSRERALSHTDWMAQEALRTDVLAIIETCRDNNRLIANNPVISEGVLGDLLYELRQSVQHYEFNRVHAVSRLDQLDFSAIKPKAGQQSPCFVWDSELHVNDDQGLDEALQVICQTYGMDPGNALGNQTANRFQRLRLFARKLWRDAVDFAEYLALDKKPRRGKTTEEQQDDITIINNTPYYSLSGFTQEEHDDLTAMVQACSGVHHKGWRADDVKQAKTLLRSARNGFWVHVAGSNQIIARMNNQMVSLRYAERGDRVHLLPNGDDLYELSQVSKQHLFFLERLQLGFRAFLAQLPAFFIHLYRHLKHTILVEIPEDFHRHVHGNHPRPMPFHTMDDEPDIIPSDRKLDTLHDVLTDHGLMTNGESLEDFIRHYLGENPYVIVREQHRHSPVAYNNPLHRTLGILRHFSAFFVDASEKNPIAGTAALGAYLYGAGAILTPQMMTSLFTKLHLNGLLAGIEATQDLGKWMSNGTVSEAIAAAATYWQGMIIAGDFDAYLIQLISVLRDQPAQVAIVITLAIAMGYGTCRIFPSLQEEMGRFPYINYAALGAKSGLAPIYDTIMHPGDDWLLGSLKWLLRGVHTFGKMVIAPFVEGYHYGFRQHFRPALAKSGRLFVKTLKQTLAALGDVTLALASTPFLELNSLLIHVPFRGLTNGLSRLLGILGHWQPIGRNLLAVAERKTSMNYLPGYRVSLLYGFRHPLNHNVTHPVLSHLAPLWIVLVIWPLQAVKNLLVLPLFDGLSLLTRCLLMVIDPMSRLLAFGLGHALVLSGFVWDHTAGLVFRTAAEGVTLSSNWLDNKAGAVKQGILSLLQVMRRGLQYWAFSEDDLALHHSNRDIDYFLEKPVRLERLPHEHNSTACLLSTLLQKTVATTDKATENTHHHALWRQSLPVDSDEEPAPPATLIME